MSANKPMKTNGSRNWQQGLTLIEILIALLLGAFLIGGVLEIFVNSRETNRMQEALSRLQENARFAMEFIGRDLRMAGYSFCPRVYTSGVDPLANFIAGVDGAVDDPLDASTQDAPDSISMIWIGGNSCPQTLATDTVNVAYAIVNNPATGVRDLQRNGAPLIEGVENMQILYGYDTGATQRSTPAFYGAWVAANRQQVVSVRVSLLLYSSDPSVLDTAALTVFNNENTVSDRRVRRVFTSTFVLRNRYGVILDP
jgi:type IV pilus assembly protein PilW